MQNNLQCLQAFTSFRCLISRFQTQPLSCEWLCTLSHQFMLSRVLPMSTLKSWYCWWFRNPAITTWDAKSLVNTGINYQPQLVIAGFLNHQQYHQAQRCCTYSSMSFPLAVVNVVEHRPPHDGWGNRNISKKDIQGGPRHQLEVGWNNSTNRSEIITLVTQI